MTTTSNQNHFRNSREMAVVDNKLFGKKVGIFLKLFGCGHPNLSRPFSRGRLGYRTCLRCGARKPFNPETLTTFGDFYYPPISKADF
ncbi:MAG: hypothetical protein JWN60_2822 [Acidobacteria bacterium]|jgi:hypothetical protein|nr:hypothetical protein [Acidobacteriota bacterium]